MRLEEEVAAYLAGLTRRNQLAKLEAMAERPGLKIRRKIRPRVSLLRALVRYLFNR